MRHKALLITAFAMAFLMAMAMLSVVNRASAQVHEYADVFEYSRSFRAAKLIAAAIVDKDYRTLNRLKYAGGVYESVEPQEARIVYTYPYRVHGRRVWIYSIRFDDMPGDIFYAWAVD